MRLDSKDHMIIAELREDSRASIRNIAKKLGMRPSTVHQRIKKLESSGVIEKFTLKLNNKAVGEDFIVFIMIATEKIFDKEFFSSDNIKEAFGITGEYDLLIKMKFKDVSEFNDFVLNLRKEYGLKKTLTMISTVTIKEEI